MERVPILRMGRFLLITIQIEMDDRIALMLQEDLTSQIEKTGARGVLIDISALEVVDSFIGRMIGNISAMSQILDAQTVLVGMQPAVAITLVELGLTLPGVRSALNVERGMAMLTASEAVAGMAVARRESLSLVSEQDVVLARQAVRKSAQQLGFSIVEQTKIITAASELVRNAIVYGGGGTLEMEMVEKNSKRGLQLIVSDQGPGIKI